MTESNPTMAPEGRVALVVGASGITGSAATEELLDQGWTVLALSRRPVPARAGVTPIAADLTSPDSLRAALGDHGPSHVFFTAWLKQDSEAENIRVNAGMVRDLLAALVHAPVRHVALVTGLKHYLGPFEAYAAGEMPDTPFHEDEPRLPVANFYYAQEDELWAAAARQGFTWSVHRSHTVIGSAVGNAMNMGQTLAVQATICRELGLPFVFPGSQTQWNGLTDMTDAGVLAEHLVWAATSPAAAGEAFNVVNGDIFRWRWMWPKIAAYFGVEAAGFAGEPQPLERQMAGREDVWAEIVARHGLAEGDLARVATWWHTDSDLGRNIEVVTDMSKSRLAGFTGYRRTEDAFVALFDRLKDDRLIP